MYSEYKKNRKLNTYLKLPYPKLLQDTTTAIIIPYRDRQEHLAKFIDNLSQLEINAENVHIFIIEQGDKKKFNRGLLLNIGYKLIEKQNFDVIIFHDVDLLPQQDIINYYFTIPKYPLHIAKRWTSKYDFNEFFGGIVAFTPKMFQSVNGFPNDFHGWGGEDDALYNRIAQTYKKILHPTQGTILELSHALPTKSKINLKKRENILRDLKNWKNNGLNNVKYDILAVKTIKNITHVLILPK